MTKKEAAEFLGVGLRSLERYTSEGRVSARRIRTRTGQIADYDEQDLQRLKDELFAHHASSSPDLSAISPPGQTGSNSTVRPKLETALVVVGRSDYAKSSHTPPHSAMPEMRLARRGEMTEALVSAKPGLSTPDPFITSIRLVLTIAEASLLTGFSTARIRDAVKTETLKSQRIGRAWRIRRADLEIWVNSLF